jgi:hypothetical protein
MSPVYGLPTLPWQHLSASDEFRKARPKVAAQDLGRRYSAEVSSFCPMSLTFHPARLSLNLQREDYSVREFGVEIGQVYEDLTAARPESIWFWSIMVLGPGRSRIKKFGRAPSLAEAQAQFSESWQEFKRHNAALKI